MGKKRSGKCTERWTDKRKRYRKLSNVIIAVYNKDGNLILTRISDESLLAGNNKITFNNMFFENAVDAGFILKCFVWDGTNTLKPIANSSSVDM